GNPHLFPDWVRESAVGDAAVGDIVRHEATRGSDSSTRPGANDPCRSGPSNSRILGHRMRGVASNPVLIAGHLTPPNGTEGWRDRLRVPSRASASTPA